MSGVKGTSRRDKGSGLKKELEIAEYLQRNREQQQQRTTEKSGNGKIAHAIALEIDTRDNFDIAIVSEPYKTLMNDAR